MKAHLNKHLTPIYETKKNSIILNYAWIHNIRSQKLFVFDSIKKRYSLQRLRYFYRFNFFLLPSWKGCFFKKRKIELKKFICIRMKNAAWIDKWMNLQFQWYWRRKSTSNNETVRQKKTKKKNIGMKPIEIYYCNRWWSLLCRIVSDKVKWNI